VNVYGQSFALALATAWLVRLYCQHSAYSTPSVFNLLWKQLTLTTLHPWRIIVDGKGRYQTQNSKSQDERIGLVIMQTSITPRPHNQEKSSAGLQRFATQKCEACANEEQEGQIRP
jgi:hypothetical protein